MSPEDAAAADHFQAAEEMVGRLRHELSHEVRRRGVSLREVGRRTGRSEDYWSKLLRGLRKLHVEHVYQALAAVGCPPEEFFARLHPAGLAGLEGLDREALRALALLGKAGEAAERLLQSSEAEPVEESAVAPPAGRLAGSTAR